MELQKASVNVFEVAKADDQSTLCGIHRTLTVPWVLVKMVEFLTATDILSGLDVTGMLEMKLPNLKVVIGILGPPDNHAQEIALNDEGDHCTAK